MYLSFKRRVCGHPHPTRSPAPFDHACAHISEAQRGKGQYAFRLDLSETVATVENDICSTGMIFATVENDLCSTMMLQLEHSKCVLQQCEKIHM